MSGSSGSATKNRSINYWIHSAICVAFIFGFGLLEPFGSLEKLGMQVLGIFIGLLYGWTFIGFIWPSLVGLLALGFTDYGAMGVVLAEGFGNIQVTILVLFVFILAAYLNKIGLSSYIANWFISRKFTIGKPWLFSLMILLVAYILGATVSLTASIVLIWSIFYNICDVVGFKKGDKYPTIMLVAIVFSAMLGFAVFPFKALQLLMLGSLENVSGLTVDFFDFTVLTFFITAASLLAFMVVFRFLLRPDVTPLTTDTDHFAHLRGQKLDRDQKIGAFFLVFFIFAMFAPSLLPKASLLGKIFTRLGTTGSLILVVTLIAVVKIQGKPIMDFGEAARGINWDIVIMFVATMPVAHAMSSPDTGVMTFIVEILEPIFQGMSPDLFIIVFVLVGGIVTQVAHNLVLGALLTPIAYSFSVTLGVNPLLTVTLLTYALAVAIATPGGSAPGALIYVNREWIDVASAYKYTAIIVVLNLVVMLIVGIPLGHIIFR